MYLCEFYCLFAYILYLSLYNIPFIADMKLNHFTALLLTATVFGLVSCHYDYDYTLSTEEVFTRAFIKEFGLIDPDHTWGFSEASQSRACDPNGGTVWVLPDAVTDYEREAVRRYLNQDDKSNIKTVSALSYTRYYITHVYANPHKIAALNGDLVETSTKMNYLVVGETAEADVLAGAYGGDGCTHVNDFNAAQNTDFKGHMVMYDSGTYDFAYHNSLVNANYDNYIIIAGADVDEFMKGETYTGSDAPISLAKHFYVCFDYKARWDATAEYRVQYKYMDGETEKVGAELLLQYKVTEDNDFSTLPSEDWFKQELKNKVADLSSVDLSNITITKYSTLTVNYAGADKWVNEDGIYDDWVVRIIGNAKKLTDPDPEIGTTSTVEDDPSDTYAKRVMVEDLSVKANYEYGVSSSDWDYNDLVFNATIDSEGKAKIKVMALGGTIPIYIADKDGNLMSEELHSYFGQPYTKMINTNAGPSLNPVALEAEISHLVFTPGDYNSIRVFAEIDGVLKEIEANIGKPTGKICVPTNKRWMGERRNIKLDNPGFEEWVNDQGKTDWMYSN